MSVETSIIPIWKTCRYTADNISAPYVDYRVSLGATPIYNGRSYASNSSITIELNEIFADYISTDIDINEADYQFSQSDTASREFQLSILENDAYEIKHIYQVYNDWSYEERPFETTDLVYLSDPISFLLDKRQKFLFTTLSYTPKDIKVYFNSMLDESGTTSLHTTFIQDLENATYPGDFEPSSFNEDYYLWQYGSANLTRPMVLNFNNVYRFNIETTCKDYCLYYVNAYGGWDSLLVTGKSMKTDNYTNSEYRQNFDNSLKSNWGKINFKKSIKRTWKLNTGFLLDTQGAKMFHLLGSTKVYLHDLNTGEIYSVVVNNKNCDYKTYINQGHKGYNYSIEVEDSQEKQRR